ncbi:20957_t:CDS:1, partial [Cetraspora pellucida]
QNVETQVEQILHEKQRPKPKKCFIEKEKRLITVFNDQENRNIMEFLHRISDNLSAYLSL